MKKVILLCVFAVIATGTVFGQVRFWWWGRAQVTPYERSWDKANTEDGNQEDGHMNSYIWWSRFGITANGGGTIGFDAETATMLTNTGAWESHLGGTWADWADFWSYSMWYKPVNWLFVRVGKWNYVPEGSAWIMEFFDRTRYSMVGLGEHEFFTGYSNMVQLNPGTVASGASIPAGVLFEGYWGPLTFDINFKSIDPQMKHLDYLRTIQVGVRWDIPGFGFIRLQGIGFDPDGEVAGNYHKVDGATSQAQLAFNITAVPGMEFRIAGHYYLSKSHTNWVDGLNPDYNFIVDKNSFAIPFGYELTMFTPLTFRVIGNMQFGKDLAYGKTLSAFKGAAQVKYVFSSYVTGLVNVSAYNFGKEIKFKSDLNAEVLTNRDPAVDVGLGVQLTNIKGGNIQTGVIFQYHTAPGTQLGIAVPLTFDFGF